MPLEDIKDFQQEVIRFKFFFFFKSLSETRL